MHKMLVDKDVTFKEFSDLWFRLYKANKGVNTQRMYMTALKKTEDIDGLKISEITIIDLQLLVNNYYQSPRACELLVMTLSQIFKSAVSLEITKTNPASCLDQPKKKKNQRRKLTEAETDASRQLLRQVDDRLLPDKKMFLACLYYLGLRPEEVRGLMVSDFDFFQCNVTIQRAVIYKNSQPVVKETKTGMIRVIPVPDAVVEQLKWYCKSRTTAYLFTKYNSSTGELMSQTSYKNCWRQIKKAINNVLGGSKRKNLVEGLTPYCFRRNYATYLYYSNITVKKAAYLMGHGTTRMILEVYAQIDEERENIDAIREFK